MNNMDAPVKDLDSRWDRLFEPLAQHMRVYDDDGHYVGIRQDVLSALNLMVIDLSGDALVHPDQISAAERFIVFRTPTVHNAVGLFWNMYQPRLYAFFNAEDNHEGTQDFSSADLYRRTNPPAPASSPQLDGLLLECLDWMYDRFQVPYEPDSDSAEMLLGLVVELHVAAARAFKLKQLEESNMSEEWVGRLRSVERTVRRIKAIADQDGDPYWDPSFAISTEAIWGMVQLDLSRVSRAEGSYADAIDYIEQASTSYMHGLQRLWDPNVIQALLGVDVFGDSNNADAVDMHGGSPWTSSLNWNKETVKNEETIARRGIEIRLTPLEVSLQETASSFNLLKQSSSSDVNWKKITDSCYWLSILPDVKREVFSGVEDFIEIEDEYGQLLLSWSEFWHRAWAWASAQLSPSEYRKLRADDEKHAAEARLKNYFFGNDWPHLPERAKQRLINADLIWNSPQRVSRESILNDLLRVVEEMCEQFMFQPLMNEERTRSEILSIEARVAKDWRRAALGVREYIWICNIQSLPSFLEELQLAEDEIQFVTRRLPTAMRQLTDARNPAEHEVGSSAPPKLVNIAYRLYLGIGQPGILPELARIGRKLQVHRPRR